MNLIRLFFVIGAIGAIGAIMGGLNLVINPHDTRSAVKLLVESVFCCGFGVILYIHYNNQYLKIKKKQQKQDELLLSILKESKIYIVEGRELLYKFEGSDYEGRLFPSKRKYNEKKYAIFVDERNNYINKWFGIGGKSFGSIVPREIPWNIIGTKKIYIIIIWSCPRWTILNYVRMCVMKINHKLISTDSSLFLRSRSRS